MSANLKFTIACSVAAASLALSLSLASAAEQVSKETIVNALTPKKPLTRSLSMSPAEQAKEAETKKFVDTLRNRQTRSLSSTEREQIATIAQDKPRIDLEIKFEFNSAQIARSAMADMEALGKALSDPALKGSTIALAGHTDASGGEDVNQNLSERRADAVKQYPGREVQPGAGESGDRRLRQDPAQGQGPSALRREPPRRNRQHG